LADARKNWAATPPRIGLADARKYRAVTPMEAIVSREMGQPALRRMRTFNGKELQKLDGKYKPLMDVSYPEWVFKDVPSIRANRLSGTSPSISTPGQRTRRFQPDAPTFTRTFNFRENRSLLERIIDKIDDWIW
jgi:hypothetical protein